MTGRKSGAALGAPSLPRHRSLLSCGATLLVSPRPHAPVCAVQAHVRGGHSLDPPERQGLAHLTGWLVDQGTASHSEEEIAAILEPVGGGLQGSSTGVTGHVAGEAWRTLLELLAECLTRPTYPEARFERQKKRLLDRLLVEGDEPRVQGARLFRKLVYGDHWLGRSEHGTLESVGQIGRKDVVRHHRQWCGARTAMAVCGDVDPERVRRLLERRLAGWTRGKDLPPPDTRFPALARRTGVFTAQRQQVHLFLGHLGIQRTHPDYAPLVVMDHVLGTGPGFTNRISRRLRDELGLAYTVHASIHQSAGVLPGTFTAYIATSPEKVRTALRGFLREIGRIQQELVPPAELELAKSYLTGSFPLGFERAARRVHALVSAHRNGLPEDHLRRLLESFGRVTAEDVRRVARAHLHPRASCIAAAGPVAAKDLETGAKARRGTA